MAGDDFLSRWSRRKREVARETPAPEATPPLSPIGTERELPATEADAPRDDVIEDAIAALPSLDSLTVETDMTPFLKAGIPQGLRNAALRRMWSIDPGIRDYLGEAREYAFDWHVPGAVPGTGPMLPTDDIAAMVREVFAGTPPAASEPVPEEETAGQEPPADAPDHADGLSLSGHAKAAEGENPTAIAAAEPVVADPGEAVACSPAAQPREARPTRLRRHGGALPI